MAQMDDKLRASIPPQYELLYDQMAKMVESSPEMAAGMFLSVFADLLVTRVLYADMERRCQVLEVQNRNLFKFHGLGQLLEISDSEEG